jgi:putative spermidine/putrescine transport system permease protein
MDRRLSEAAEVAGAGPWRVLVTVLIPMMLPGLLAGWILVFASSCMNFVTQAVIGGARLIYLPQFIYQEVTTLYDWPFAAAIAIVMLTTTGIVMAVLTAVSRNRRINVYA